MLRKSARKGWIALVAVLFVFAACSSDGEETTAEEAQEPVDITIAADEEIPTLDPQARDFAAMRLVTENIFESLLARDPKGVLVPQLAVALPEQTNDTTWRFQIQEGVEFSNGEPMNADAVVASIERIIDPTFESQLLDFFSTFKSATAVDEYTVDVKTKGVDVLLPARIQLIKIVPPEASQDKAFAHEPVGTGPYVFESSEGAGGPFVLTKNPDYWGGEVVSVDTVTVRTIADVSTRVSALEAGEVDLITLPPDSVESAPQSVSVVGILNPFLTLNAGLGVTADEKVRQALNYAIDRDALAEQLYSGFAQPSQCQVVAPAAVGYNESLEAYPYDPEMAKKLVSEAGAEGETITLVTSDYFPKGREIGETLAAYWTDAGLKVDLQVPDFDHWLELLYAKGDDRPNAVYSVTSTDLLDAAASSRQLTTDGDQSAYSNPQVDQLFTEAQSTADVDARDAVYEEAGKIACDEAALVNLLNPEDIYGLSDRMDWQPRIDGYVIAREIAVSS